MHTQALVFSAAHTCEVASYDLPEELGRGEVLLRNRLGLISPGTELAMFCATHRGFDVEGHWARFPYYPGYCSVADVVAVGDRVTGTARCSSRCSASRSPPSCCRRFASASRRSCSGSGWSATSPRSCAARPAR